MSTLAATKAPSGASAVSTHAVHRPGFAAAMRSEWTKLRTVRSTPITVIAAAVLTIGFGIIASATYAHHIGGIAPSGRAAALDSDGFDPVSYALVGVILAQIAFGVLGVLAISGEYGSGSIRTTLTAVPKRSRVLGAKAASFGLLAVIVGQVIAFAGFFIGQIFFSSQHLDVGLGHDGVLRAVIGTGIYLALTGLLGLGIGSIVRHTAGAITTLVVLLLVLGPLTSVLPGQWDNRIGKFTPDSIGSQATNMVSNPDHFAPITGLGVMAAYVVALLGIGVYLMRRRDA